ncbi:hypothetical protein D3C76_1173520 [compost metagenome]
MYRYRAITPLTTYSSFSRLAAVMRGERCWTITNTASSASSCVSASNRGEYMKLPKALIRPGSLLIAACTPPAKAWCTAWLAFRCFSVVCTMVPSRPSCSMKAPWLSHAV